MYSYQKIQTIYFFLYFFYNPNCTQSGILKLAFFGIQHCQLNNKVMCWYPQNSYNLLKLCYHITRSFPDGSNGKESACNTGDPGSIPGLGRSPATHSSIFAWRIPWTENPEKEQSMGLQRAGYDWAINTHAI